MSDPMNYTCRRCGLSCRWPNGHQGICPDQARQRLLGRQVLPSDGSGTDRVILPATAEDTDRATTDHDWRSIFVPGDRFALDVPDTVPAVWGDGSTVLWAQGEALMLCGPPGVGKTTVAGQLIVARLGLHGLAGKVLGLPVATGNRLLYLACDRPAQVARSLHRIMKPEWREELAERLVIWKGPPPHDFAKDTSLMREMALAAGADTVMIDSLKDVAIGLSEDTVGAGYNRARQLTLVAGIEVAELHHQVKHGTNGAAPTKLIDVYGSTWLTAGAGSVVLLWGEAGDPLVRLTHLKQPADEVGPFNVLHDHKAGTSSVHQRVDLVRLAAYSPAGLTAHEAAKVIFETTKPTRAQVEKARRRLDQLAGDDRLIPAKGRAGGDQGGSPTTYHAPVDEDAYPSMYADD